MTALTLRGQCRRRRLSVIAITTLLLGLLVTPSQALSRPCPKMSAYADFQSLQPAINPQPQSQLATVSNSASACPNHFGGRSYPYYVQQSMDRTIPMKLGFQLPFTIQVPDCTPSNIRPRPYPRPITPYSAPVQYDPPPIQPQRQPFQYSGQTTLPNSQPSDDSASRCNTANQSPPPESYSNTGIEPVPCAQSNYPSPSEQAYQQQSSLSTDDCAC